MIKNRQIVVQCDGHYGDGLRCSSREIFPENTTTPVIESSLRGLAWTIRGGNQLCDIHGHQAPRREESHA